MRVTFGCLAFSQRAAPSIPLSQDEAVKMMKIGGTATNITLNPLNAIRSAATSALRSGLVRLVRIQTRLESSNPCCAQAVEQNRPTE